MPTPDKDLVLTRMTGRWVEFYGQFTKLHQLYGEYRGACPIHGGEGLNFAVKPNTGDWFCHSTCQRGGDALGFVMAQRNLDFPSALREIADWAGIVADTSSLHSVVPFTKRIKATYDYTDEGGVLVFQVVRYEPKSFRQRRPDGQGGWVFNLDGVRRLLYRLPELLAAIASGEIVYIVEGEKDVETLRGLGLVATCNPMGAGKWTDGYTAALAGADVVILPDNDEPGRQHAQAVAAAIYRRAKRIRVVELTGLCAKGDVSDWVGAGGTATDLAAIVDHSADWQPTAPSDDPMPTAPAVIVPVPDQAMFYGILGRIVAAFDPHTEANAAAVMFSLIVAVGNVIGRSPYQMIEQTQHHCNLNAVIVGPSSTGRKGTAWDIARSVVSKVDTSWADNRILGGLSSGEGLLHAVRDATLKKDEVVDEGASDKRLLVVETEFGRCLKVSKRESNTLSSLIRQAWDSGNLRVMTKQATVATGAHISIIAHITPEELRRDLDAIDVLNGFGNRFLWAWSKRSKRLPDGSSVDWGTLLPLVDELRATVQFACGVERVERDSEARHVWHSIYGHLTEDEPGAYGALTARGAPTVVRLSVIFALLDESVVVQQAHMLAALAVWDYCVQSVRYVFDRCQADPITEKLMDALRRGEDGMTATDISALFGHNLAAGEYNERLNRLKAQGRVAKVVEKSTGKPVTRWYAI